MSSQKCRTKKNYHVKTYTPADEPQSSTAPSFSTHRNTQFCKTKDGQVSTARSLIKVDLGPEENTPTNKKPGDDNMMQMGPHDPEPPNPNMVEGYLHPPELDGALLEAAYIEHLQELGELPSEEGSSGKRKRMAGVSDIRAVTSFEAKRFTGRIPLELVSCTR